MLSVKQDPLLPSEQIFKPKIIKIVKNVFKNAMIVEILYTDNSASLNMKCSKLKNDLEWGLAVALKLIILPKIAQK